MQTGHTAEAVIADAVGGECADAAMDFLQKQASAELARQGMRMAEFRFSPGYGDWTLEAQKFFFEILPMEEMGIRLHESMLMIPEKSVTATAGIVCG
jgi:cobalamin-dependent methionine synthase I